MATEFLSVELDLLTHKITCPCLWTVETGKPCYHGAAVILETESEWNDLRWFHKIYHLSTYKQMYGTSNLPQQFQHLESRKEILFSFLKPLNRRDVPRGSVANRTLQQKGCAQHVAMGAISRKAAPNQAHRGDSSTIERRGESQYNRRPPQ
jgi:hypothetical protein